MPSWTLGDLMSQATTRIGRRADIAQSDASLWVNQAYLDFTTDVPDLLSEKTHYFSVSSGDSLIDLPDDCLEPLVISHQTTGSGSTLRRLSPEWADRQGYYPVGEPQGYFVYNDQIQLWPSANSSALTTHASSGRSYLLRFRARPEDMVSTSSVPSVATEARIGILFKSEIYLNQLVGNVEESIIAETRYVNFVSSLKDALAKKQADRTKNAISFVDRRNRRLSGDADGDSPWLKT